MTEAADLILTGGEGHTLTEPDETVEAVAVRDGEIVRAGDAYEVGFLEGVETEVIDLDGRVLLPGFVDAHVHFQLVGQYERRADLDGAESRAEAIERLRAEGAADDWIVGFRYDESDWEDARRLTREDLGRVSEDRPVVAFRVDMHGASLNGAALDRVGDDLPPSDVVTEGGDPTGVVVEEALDRLWEVVVPDREEARELLRAAQARAHALGLTGVHDMVRNTRLPWAYRALDRDDELRLRVTINYWIDHLEAIAEAGLAPGGGSEFVRVGAIKTYSDGSIGSRTARLAEPYADAADERGQWVVDPDDLRAIVEKAAAAGFPTAIHAIGDEAIDAALDAFASVDAEPERESGLPGRIEHAELATDEQIERLSAADVVASAQPNFLQWADDGGLYDARLGRERRERSNRFRRWLDAGVDLAFGSDSMPMDPLYGIHRAVNAPSVEQRLGVTEALRAYTSGAARAAGDDDRLGTIEPGTAADLVALDRSPWEHADAIDELAVELTVVDGDVVYDDRTVT